MNTRMRTHTGNSFDFRNIEDNDISIEDIASGLSKECRFAGQTKEDVFVSVAQHAVIVSYLVPPEVAYEALHHDSSEAYTGDIPTPMKHLLPDFIKMENRVQKHIYDKLGIAVTNHPSIKEADARVLSMEACFNLAGGKDPSLQFSPWGGFSTSEANVIYNEVGGLWAYCEHIFAHARWDIPTAKAVFLTRHNYLKAEYEAKYKPKPKGLLIGLTGKAGAGKDTTADIIEEQLGKENVFRISFAQPIRDMLKAAFPFLTDEHFYGTLKEEVIPGLGKSPRQLMQTLGTEWGRQCVKDSLWVDTALQKAKEARAAGKHVVITDVRFENESTEICAAGGHVVEIARPSHKATVGVTSNHPSEGGVKGVDIVVENIADISYLKEEVAEMLEIVKGEQ
jgi:hypothetical protein